MENISIISYCSHNYLYNLRKFEENTFFLDLFLISKINYMKKEVLTLLLKHTKSDFNL